MNPVALITGASRGIGRGIALELAKLGYDVMINYLGNAEAAGQTIAACLAAAQTTGRTIRAVSAQADISRAADRQRLLALARSTFSRLDLLVNNAGIAPRTRADLLDASEESFDHLIAVNVKGPFFLTQLAAQWMLEQQAVRAQAGAAAEPFHPKIVTVSSISAYAASVNRGDYCMSKAALTMLTPLFAARLAADGIQVFELRPGIIDTDMTAPVRAKYDALIASGLTPMPRWGTPADVGQAVVAIVQERFPFSTGEVFNVDGGFHLRRL
ncbi:MAG: 3-ketoacyl-ACP reductase [Verrucomicrobia bacterium]|nr:3-ketoacyl-ACP reductase [Verrucomicrobiota bacterium]